MASIRLHAHGLATLVAALVIGFVPAPAALAQAPTAGRKVLAVVAMDSYGDLKQQLAWLGPHVENPGLAASIESVLLLATQGQAASGASSR